VERKGIRRGALTILSVLSFLVCVIDADADSVAATKHNLSASGPGLVKATSETQTCKFCHTPHGAVARPLWNRSFSSASYKLPSSKTMKSRPANPPDGDSRLCLSCHDGTVAIGAIVNLGGAITNMSMQGGSRLGAGQRLSSSSPAYFGTDLSGHHPISIEVNQSLVADKDTQGKEGTISWKVCAPRSSIKLRPTQNRYGAGGSGLGVQCTSCHDAHSDKNGKFLRVGTPSDSTELCLGCHALRSTACP